MKSNQTTGIVLGLRAARGFDAEARRHDHRADLARRDGDAVKGAKYEKKAKDAREAAEWYRQQHVANA